MRVGIAAAALAMADPAGAQPAANPCVLTADEQAWIQGALDDWHLVSRDFLRMEEPTVPWMVFIGPECAWHVAAKAGDGPDLAATLTPSAAALTLGTSPLDVRHVAHSGTVRLPGGGEVPVAPLSFAGPVGESGEAFFLMAMPSVWRRDPRTANEPDPETLLRAVFAHEITHTQQVAALYRRIDALEEAAGSPDDFDDDIVQSRFDTVPGFRAAYEAERDLLFRAAAESDSAQRRTLAGQALAAARERRARYFTGANAIYADIEDVFLNMEGVANWAAYRVILHHAGPGADGAQVLRAIRRGGRKWSQDEGLALFLVFDALLPGWQQRVLGPEPPSVFTLLAEAAGAQRAVSAEATPSALTH
ncbi:MAG TPA: hypothetical protein VEY93_07770 [Longimicrobium sp.]|nr:hypothetical protein [Longimicrobium sp.]